MDAHTAAEEAVLSHLAAVPEDAPALWAVAGSIRGWTGPRRAIATAVAACMAESVAPDVVAVGTRLHAAGHGSAIGLYVELGGRATPGVEALHAAHELLRLDARHGLEAALSEALGSLRAGGDQSLVEARLHGAIRSAQQTRGDSVVVSSESQSRELGERIWEAVNGGQPPFVSTLNPDIDSMICGVREGYWTVIGARPKQGKSAWWEQLVTAHAQAGAGSIVASLELEPWEHIERMAIRESRCRLSSRQLYEPPTDATIGRHLSFHEARDRIGELPILWVRSRKRRGISQLIADLTLAHQEAPEARLVVVDYLQLVRAEGRSQRRDLDLGDVSQALCEWIAGRGLAGILVAQLNRALEREPGRKPRLSDLRECGQLEQDAASVLLLHRPDGSAESSGRQECAITVAAARWGLLGDAPLWWIGPEMRFEAREACSWI